MKLAQLLSGIAVAAIPLAPVMAVAATERVSFAGGAETHYENRTQRLVGTAAEGDDFRIVRKPGMPGDTAWRVASMPVAVPAGMKFASLDFEIYSDADWHFCKMPNGDGWASRFVWMAADGSKVAAPSWVDALGVSHDSEIFDPDFRAKRFSRFRVVAEIPAQAATLSVQFARDSPNVKEGERVSVRNCTLTFRAAGEARPEPIVPDVTGPAVKIAFPSPNSDERVAVRYSVTDRSGVDWASLVFTENGEKIAYQREGDTVVLAPGRVWPRGDHHVRVVVRDVNGCETRETKAFRIGERPNVPGTTLRKDGVMLVGGKPVFPIGFYGLCPREANLYSLERCFSDIAAAGINLAHSYTHPRDPEFIRGCARHGMVSFMAEHYAAEGSKGFEGTWRQEPTVGLWYVGDDTAMHHLPEVIANRVEALNALDGTRLTCHADVHTSRFKDYADLVDVFMPEIYPVRGDANDKNCVAATIDVMEKSMRDVRNTSSGKVRTVWPIIQYFKGYTGWKCAPTPAEVYAMSFAAIIHGGLGITWYTYGGFVDPEKKKYNYGVCSSAEMWHATTNLTRLLSKFAPVFISGEVAQPPVPEVLSGPKLDACARASVTVLLKRYEGATYVFAVNSTRETVKARIFTNLASAATGSVLSESRKVQANDGAFTDDFAPIAVHIYRFK